MTFRKEFERGFGSRMKERFSLLQRLIGNLDHPDLDLDAIWAEESERRLKADREGRLEGISMEERFKGPSR